MSDVGASPPMLTHPAAVLLYVCLWLNTHVPIFLVALRRLGLAKVSAKLISLTQSLGLLFYWTAFGS